MEHFALCYMAVDRVPLPFGPFAQLCEPKDISLNEILPDAECWAAFKLEVEREVRATLEACVPFVVDISISSATHLFCEELAKRSNIVILFFKTS